MGHIMLPELMKLFAKTAVQASMTRTPLFSVIAMFLLTSLAGAQPIFGTHEPRTYDERIIPNFSFEVIEIDARGQLGVAVLDTESGRYAGWADEATFPLNSTFKFLVCAAVLERVDQGAERLDREIAISDGDIVAHAPAVRQRVGGTMTVDALCHAAMTLSDNAAANLLLETLGGPAGLTARLRAWGDPASRLDRNEPGLNDVAPDDPRDRTSPRAMLHHLEHLLLGDTLSAQSRDRLHGWMTANTTGAERIRAGVPEGWLVGDRTGTGAGGNSSTVAIIRPPGRKPVLMAVFIEGSSLSNSEASAIHAELARIATGNVQLDEDGFYDGSH